MNLGRSALAAMRGIRRVLRSVKRHLSQLWTEEPVSDHVAMHEWMLFDRARCEAFREAIRQTVKPGDVVVDLGAGTGLLSFFALQAGARHVYAIEKSVIAELATELIRVNGFQERISVIRGDSKKINVPERCDVLVSEILSSFGFDAENVVEYIADARKRFLKPGARIIPAACQTFLLPFSSDEIGLGRFPARFYDLDFQPFRKTLYPSKNFLVEASGKRFIELAGAAPCYHLDFYKEVCDPGSTSVPFRISADGRLDGFLGWFEAHLCPGVTLSNSPYFPPHIHWEQLHFPAVDQPQVRAGELVLLHLDPNMVDGHAEWKYRVQVAATEPSAKTA